MPMLPYKLAAIDLDDTLLGPDKRIGGENAVAVRRLLELGIRVVLASGRHHSNMTNFHRQLGLSDAIVSCNGALAKDVATDTVWHLEPLPSADAHEIITHGDRLGITQNFYHLDGGLYVREENRWTDLYEMRTGSHVLVQPDFDSFGDVPPLKMVWVDEGFRITELLGEMRDRYGDRLNILTTDPEYLEFMSPRADKAVGLAAVAARLDITAEQIIAFGDGNNDVGMLKWAGMGVAMDHGRASARAAANAIAPVGNPESSFARAVAAFVAPP